jgi:hypothetical protein
VVPAIIFLTQVLKLWEVMEVNGRSQWPHGLRHELSSLGRTLDREFESHSRHGCLCVRLFYVYVEALRWADPSSKESYRV